MSELRRRYGNDDRLGDETTAAGSPDVATNSEGSRSAADQAPRSDSRSDGPNKPVQRSLSDFYLDTDDDMFVPTDDDRLRYGGLFSRSAERSNRDVVDSGTGLTRDMDTVRAYAQRAGVDLKGIPVDVVEDPDVIRYLDTFQAIARTDADGIQLGPASFLDEETLVRTLAHERVHVTQISEGRVDSNTQRLEDEAYAAEEAHVNLWRGGRLEHS